MPDTGTQDQEQLREAVRQRYAAAATRVAQEHALAESALPVLTSDGCCGSDASCNCGSDTKSVITSDLYAIDEVADLPPAAVLASLGCGNPTTLAEFTPGETVLDLGSGVGIDVLLSAKRVRPTGFAYGPVCSYDRIPPRYARQPVEVVAGARSQLLLVARPGPRPQRRPSIRGRVRE